MKSISLQVTYQKGVPFAAYIYLEREPGQKVVSSREVAPEIVVDYDGEARPVGVEIVSPGTVGINEILAVFDELGLGRPDPSELAPLVAA